MDENTKARLRGISEAIEEKERRAREAEQRKEEEKQEAAAKAKRIGEQWDEEILPLFARCAAELTSELTPGRIRLEVGPERVEPPRLRQAAIKLYQSNAREESATLSMFCLKTGNVQFRAPSLRPSISTTPVPLVSIDEKMIMDLLIVFMERATGVQ